MRSRRLAQLASGGQLRRRLDHAGDDQRKGQRGEPLRPPRQQPVETGLAQCAEHRGDMTMRQCPLDREAVGRRPQASRRAAPAGAPSTFATRCGRGHDTIGDAYRVAGALPQPRARRYLQAAQHVRRGERRRRDFGTTRDRADMNAISARSCYARRRHAAGLTTENASAISTSRHHQRLEARPPEQTAPAFAPTSADQCRTTSRFQRGESAVSRKLASIA